MERRLSAILAADVVGYTRLMGEDEAGILVSLRSHIEDFISPLVSEHGGRIVKLMGDGILAEFHSAVGALQCAQKIQQGMQCRNEEIEQRRRIRFRMGINIGDVIVEGNDIYGDGVNIAARLEALSDPGGILLAQSAYEQVKGKVDGDFDDLGRKTLKNVADPIRVFRFQTTEGNVGAPSLRWKFHADGKVVASAAAVFLLIAGVVFWWQLNSAVEADRRNFQLPDRPSIAVLPFETFSSDEDYRYLADGVSEDIITQLARNAELTVMARSASFAVANKTDDAIEIARELGVYYLLTGSVRRSEDRLRITTQLVDGKSGNNVWAEAYDSTAAKVFDTQDEIVERIVGSLFSEVREIEKNAILRNPPESLDVYELALRGVARKHRLNPSDSVLAREDLARAIELDPDYAPAWLYLGWVEGIAIAFGWASDLGPSDLPGAISKIEKAIEIDPTLATAYQALGILRSWVGDTEGALQAAKRSVELGPGDADNILFLGRAFANIGAFDVAVETALKAFALNPIRPSYYDAALSRALWGQGSYDASLKAANDCLAKTPGYSACQVFQVASNIGLQEKDSAVRSAKDLLDLYPNMTVGVAVGGMGYAGAPSANARLSEQLSAAGLPD